MRFFRAVRGYVDGFVLALVGTAVLASLFPARGTTADVLSGVTTAAIALLFFLYGTRLSPSEAWQGLRHWRLHAVVLGFTFVVFPLIGLAARVLSPTILTPELYTGLLFATLVPSTVQSSIAFTSLARGNVAGAVVSASVSNLLGVFLTPLLVVTLMSDAGEARPDASAVLRIVLQLLVPFLLGQLVRRWAVRFTARHEKGTKLVDRGSILLVVYAAFSAGMVEGIWHAMAPWRVVAVAVVCAAILAIVLTLSTMVSRVLRFAREDRIVVVFCGSKKSLAAGLPMATVLFPSHIVGLIVLPLMIFHQIQLLTCAVLARRWSNDSVN